MQIHIYMYKYLLTVPVLLLTCDYFIIFIDYYIHNDSSLQANQSEDIYNETSARQACIHAMDRPVFSLCKAVPDLDVEPYIDSCAKDAMVRGFQNVKS